MIAPSSTGCVLTARSLQRRSSYPEWTAQRREHPGDVHFWLRRIDFEAMIDLPEQKLKDVALFEQAVSTFWLTETSRIAVAQEENELLYAFFLVIPIR